MKNYKKKKIRIYTNSAAAVIVFILFFSVSYNFSKTNIFYGSIEAMATSSFAAMIKLPEPKQELDKSLYDSMLEKLANNPVVVVSTSTVSTSTVRHLWPAKAVYPNFGALLPFNRIVAYYGNFYSTKMGALGEYPETQMLGMLMAEVEKWKLADPATPVIPAIHYIAVTAQGSAGEDGKYRLRMPESEIQKAIDMAAKVKGIVFLDIQIGLSTLQSEVPQFEKFLKLPNVHLGIDPEFSMKTGKKPGTVIGTMDATDVNFAAQYLAKLVKDNNLPPKILVVHRFTQGMVTNYSYVKPLPEVQVVIDMDGWGASANKRKAYHDFVYAEPIQFAGIKLFYKNDIKSPSTGLMTPGEILNLRPKPIYIQYQ